MAHQQEHPHFLPFFLTDTLYNLPDERVIAEAENLNKPANRVAEQPKEQASVPAQASSLPELHTVGKNHKEIAVLVHDEKHAVLSREDGLFLKNVLQAFGLTFDDVLLVNTKQCVREAHWEALQKINFRFVLAFGLAELPPFSPQALTHHYQSVESGKQAWLAADPLADISAEVAKKKQLWNALKQLLVGL